MCVNMSYPRIPLDVRYYNSDRPGCSLREGFVHMQHVAKSLILARIIKSIFKFQKCANIASGQILGKRDVNKRSVSVCSDCCTSDICNTNCRKKGK